MTGHATGQAPKAPEALDADLPVTGEEPAVAVAASGSCFLMTNGHDGGGVSLKEAAGDGGLATVVLRMERGGMLLGADATVTGGGGTRVYKRGCRFSFPLDLLLTNADFFHVSNAGMSPSPACLVSEALSPREKVLVKVKAIDAGRLVGCRAGAVAAAVAVATGVESWC